MTDGTFPKSLDELLTNIEHEWAGLMQVVDRLTPEQMTAPDSGGWSPKDNLAHLSAWMNIMLKSSLGGMPEYVAMGIEEQKFKGSDEDGENAIIFERNHNRSTDDVLNELRSTYDETVKTLKKMDFQNLMKPLNHDDPNPALVIGSVIGNTSEHFSEHRIIIERALNTRK